MIRHALKQHEVSICPIELAQHGRAFLFPRSKRTFDGYSKRRDTCHSLNDQQECHNCTKLGGSIILQDLYASLMERGSLDEHIFFFFQMLDRPDVAAAGEMRSFLAGNREAIERVRSVVEAFSGGSMLVVSETPAQANVV